MSVDLSQTKELEGLENASGQVDVQLEADGCQVELSGLFRITSHNAATASGTSDFDYPTLATQVPALASLPYVGDFKHTPLPPELIEHFDQMQCNCAMGVFAEIRRAWLTIDSNIYMWNYVDGSDLAYFDGLNEVILAVGLVVPRKGVFQDHIVYLLVLTTPVDIVILGVSFSGSHEDPLAEMHLLPEPLFTLPSDNIGMVSVVGTPAGRIFLAGQDGCLHEVVYQADDGWFHRKCRRVNHSTSVLSYFVPSFLSFSEEGLYGSLVNQTCGHTDAGLVPSLHQRLSTDATAYGLEQIAVDQSRQVLYTRSTKGSLVVFDLGRDGQKTVQVASVTPDQIVQRAMQCTRLTDRSLFQPLVYVAPLPSTDSSTLHLLAVSSAGVRFYFTTTPNGIKARPSLLALVHVRLPPGYSPSFAYGPKMGTLVHRVFYRRGLLLLAVKQSDSQDYLWMVDPDLFPFQQQLTESRVIVPVDGRVWCITEGPDPFTPPTSDLPLPPSVVTQHADAQRQFIMLTAQGSYTFTKLKQVDQLRYLLEGRNEEEIVAFFHLHKEAQACAMSLILATDGEDQVALSATEAFFRFGGEPHIEFPKSTPGGPAPPFGPHTTMASPAPQTIGSQPFASPMSTLGSLPSSVGGHGTLGKAIVGPEVVLSGKHNGLCLYLSRLVRPFWNQPLIQIHLTPDKKEEYWSRLFLEELAVYAKELNGLKEFLEANPHLCRDQEGDVRLSDRHGNLHRQMLEFMRPETLSGGHDPSHVQHSLQAKYRAEAAATEQHSLHSVYLLVVMCCECVALWRVLCEGNMNLTAEKLGATSKAWLKKITFKELVVKGKSLANELIKSMLDLHIGDSNMTESLTARLREMAPTLFSEDDATITKAHEQIVLAKACEDAHLRAAMLRESLTLLSRVTHKLNLSAVCLEYQTAHYYEGVIELCLCAAAHKDEKDTAVHHFRKGLPHDDVTSAKVYSDRIACYQPVLELLRTLHQACCSQVAPQSSVPAQPGPPSASQPPQSNPDEEFEATLAFTLRAQDPLLHFTVYQWMITSRLTDRLVQVDSPYVEEFLQHSVTDDLQSQLMVMDLLWRYYERTRNYGAAARILSKLAEGEGPHFSLDQRMEYLSRAVMCAKSTTMTTSFSHDGELLHQLEEKMEVARIQVHILKEVEQLPQTRERDEALTQLNAQLMDITTLYGQFADEFELHECKLAILHCAGHYDSGLVESLWRSIVSGVLEKSAGQPVDVQMTSVQRKIISLGQLYAQTERYFPVGFLVKLLEMQSCRFGWRVECVQETFRRVGVTVEALLGVYNNLVQANDQFWANQGRPLHVYWAVKSLIDFYLASPAAGPQYERNRFLGHTHGAVSDYVVRLETLDPSIPQLKETLNSYRSLQNQLEKMVS